MSRKRNNMFSKNDKTPDMEIFTIYDTKSKSYRAPSYGLNKHVVIREITNLLRDPAQAQNVLLLNAEDFQIFKIGEYDYQTGMITSHKPEHIANLHEIKTSLQ